jgi:molybdopterin-guanine dinucleotide biosynthesis protein A
MIEKSDLTGIILAGGKSSRMGKDKGLCRLNGKTLVSYAIETLKPLCGHLMISANHYPEKYAQFGIPVVADEIKNIGPMGGIYTCLKKSTTRHNIVLSCDTPFVGTLLLNHLLNSVKNEQIVAPSHHTFLIEPLSTYYATNVLSEIKQAIDQQDYKLINLFKRVNFKSVLMDNITPYLADRSFFNINRPEDLQAAENPITNPHEQ